MTKQEKDAAYFQQQKERDTKLRELYRLRNEPVRLIGIYDKWNDNWVYQVKHPDDIRTGIKEDKE